MTCKDPKGLDKMDTCEHPNPTLTSEEPNQGWTIKEYHCEDCDAWGFFQDGVGQKTITWRGKCADAEKETTATQRSMTCKHPKEYLKEPRKCPRCKEPTQIMSRGTEHKSGALYAVLSCGCTTKDVEWIEAFLRDLDERRAEQLRIHLAYMATIGSCPCGCNTIGSATIIGGTIIYPSPPA